MPSVVATPSEAEKGGFGLAPASVRFKNATLHFVSLGISYHFRPFLCEIRGKLQIRAPSPRYYSNNSLPFPVIFLPFFEIFGVETFNF
jgi:hypothetical protein